MAKMQKKLNRCLVLERNPWETGAVKHQIQIPLAAATDFFGDGEESTAIRVRLKHSTKVYNCSISKKYKNSTRRINELPWTGMVGHCFVFIEQTEEPDLYEIWSEYDLAMVVARYRRGEWLQTLVRGSKKTGGRGKRGRLFCIIDAPVTDDFRTLED